MGFWEWVYFIAVYAASLVCVIAAIKIWISDGWKSGLTEILILVGFAVGYWLLESHAQISAPFYIYPDMFIDMIPLFDWSQFGIHAAPATGTHPCARTGEEISVTVPLLEMVMTYCFMWTARLLLRPYGWANSVHATAVAPFMVGFMALLLDGFLDPIISQSFTCEPVAMNHSGMGYWHWFASDDLANVWYGIPAFNYAAWFAAPVLLVSIVMFLHFIVDFVIYLWEKFKGTNPTPPSYLNGLFQLAVSLAFFVMHVTALDAEPPATQIAGIIIVLVISLGIIITNASSYDRNNPFRWEFVVPQIAIFALPLGMLVFTPLIFISGNWLLLLISVLCLAVGVFFALSPYSGKWLFKT